MSSVYISPNRERTTDFPGTGANLRLRERAKGPPPSSLPSLRISTNEEKRRKTLEERSTRIYLAREPPSMVWTNGGNSKKVSNSPRDRVSRSTRKRLPTFLTMDLSFVPIARFASALNGKLVGNRSISQIARPLFLVERSIVNSFRARYIDSSKNQRCSGRDNSFLIFQMFGVFVGNFGFLPDYKITNSIVPNSAILVSNIYILKVKQKMNERYKYREFSSILGGICSRPSSGQKAILILSVYFHNPPRPASAARGSEDRWI